jgi:hypothetical protein
MDVAGGRTGVVVIGLRPGDFSGITGDPLPPASTQCAVSLKITLTP